MAILKSEIRNRYSQIPNSIIRAKDTSDAEHRLLIYLYSLPDGWKINQGYLGTELNCNRVNINKKLRRLKELGYLEIIKSKNKNTDFIYVLKEKGVSLNDVSLGDVSASDVSLSDTYINTNIINTENINNNLNISSCCYKRIEENFGRTLSSIEYEKINIWLKEFSEEIILYAVEIAVLNNKKSFNYVNGILRNWKIQNYKNLSEIKDAEFKKVKKEDEPFNELFDYNWLDDIE